MTPLPPIPGVVKLTFQFTAGADPVADVVLHWHYTGGPPSATDCNAIASAASSQFGTHCQTLYHGAVILNTVICYDLSSSTASSGQYQPNLGGSRGGSEPPANCCVQINHSIAQRYRGGRPKNFWPFGVDGDMATSTHWSSSLTSAVNTGYGAFVTALNAFTSSSTIMVGPCAVSYYQGYNPPVTLPSGKVKQSAKLRAGGPVRYDIITQSAAGRIGSQRRRLSRG